MQFEKFRQLWAANIKNLTKDDGVEVWQNFIEREVTEESMLEEAIAILTDQYHTKRENNPFTKAPMFPELRGLYYRLVNRSKQQVTKGYKCLYCGNSGYVTVVIVNRQICDPKTPQSINGKDAGVFVESCICALGDNYVPWSRKEEANKKRMGNPNDGTGYEWEYLQKCREFDENKQEQFRGNQSLDGNVHDKEVSVDATTFCDTTLVSVQDAVKNVSELLTEQYQERKGNHYE